MLLSGRGDLGSYGLSVGGIQIVDDYANASSAATALVFGTTVQGAREYDNDVDVFVFEAEAGTRYRIEAESGDLYRLEVAIEQADERELRSEYNDDQDEYLPMFWKARTSGNHYVVVSGQGRGSYHLSVSKILDDHANDPSEATPIRISRTVAGSLEHDYDRDVFVFEAVAGVFYEIGVDLDTLPTSRLILEDVNGVELAEAEDYQEPEPSRIYWLAPTSGPHYVYVRGGNARVFGSYSLTVAVSQLTDLHANTSDGATTVEVGEPLRGTLEYESDVDVLSSRLRRRLLPDPDRVGNAARREAAVEASRRGTLSRTQLPGGGRHSNHLGGERRRNVFRRGVRSRYRGLHADD